MLLFCCKSWKFVEIAAHYLPVLHKPKGMSLYVYHAQRRLVIEDMVNEFVKAPTELGDEERPVAL